MGIRHLARQRSFQLLYALEYAGSDETFENVETNFLNVNPSHRRGWGPFARQLAHTVFDHREQLDVQIAPMLKNWTMDRLPVCDRICLRMAVAELEHFAEIPLRVTLNEYIEVARLFGNDDSPQYINAVLDRLAKNYKHKDFKNPEEELSGQSSLSGESSMDED